MYSKWSDSFSQLQGFINSSIKAKKANGEEVIQLEHARFEVTHYFSLLSAMAVERLMRGDIRRMQLRRAQGAAWSEQVVFREHLRYHDLVGSKQLCKMKLVDLNELQRVTVNESEAESEPHIEVKKNICGGSKTCTRRPAAHTSHMLKKLGKTNVRKASFADYSVAEDEDIWQGALPVIGPISKEEKVRLQASEDRINLVIAWINQQVTEMVPMMNVPAPILSRVYQEISNGALGYSQAEKLADIPFPFIFAQILALAVMTIACVSPIAFEIITGRTALTPFISTVVVLSFWSLNEMAKELENPFGVEANNVPIVDHHERFVSFIGEIHGCNLPADRSYKSNGHANGLPTDRPSHGSHIPECSPECSSTGGQNDHASSVPHPPPPGTFSNLFPKPLPPEDPAPCWQTAALRHGEQQ